MKPGLPTIGNLMSPREYSRLRTLWEQDVRTPEEQDEMESLLRLNAYYHGTALGDR